MKRSNRIRWLGAIALGVIVLITLIAAPSNSNLRTGSSYNRAPDGYGAWYAFMQQQGTPVQRWQKPFSNLAEVKNPITLLRVSSQPSPPSLDRDQREWVKKGNTLVILGVHGRVTAAAFSTTQQSSVGSIKIDTRRRYVEAKEQKNLLGDRFGAVVWQEQIGEGQAIFATTPNLAANAYQDYPNNYKYLAQIVSTAKPVWVDEYIHGYKDTDVREAAGGDWLTYLAQKPIFPALFQAIVLLIAIVWAQNRRFGQAIALDPPVVDNSTAYIEALAGVLQKAESSEFVLDMVGKAEQMQLQKALGLGQVPTDRQTLIKAWVEQTGRSPAELEQLLQLKSQKRRLSHKNLLVWLEKWKTIHSYVKPD
jgi:hypothetical protein